MTHDHPIGDPGELAALYALGGMSPTEAACFEAHLADGCPRCADELSSLDPVVDELLEGAGPVDPDPRVRRQLLHRVAGSQAEGAAVTADPQIWKHWDDERVDVPVILKQPAESGWESSGIPGVDFRKLFVDRARNQMSALVRMAPGTAYPAHVHDGPEECLVLEGDLRTGDTHLFKGDYQRMVPGSSHPVQSTDTGCLLLIMSSLTDELQSE